MRTRRRLDESDYIIRYMELPARVRGFTAYDESGFANVYINTALSYEMQREAIAHELGHIGRDDFFGVRTIREVEG